jgi:hypothetical protein
MTRKAMLLACGALLLAACENEVDTTPAGAAGTGGADGGSSPEGGGGAGQGGSLEGGGGAGEGGLGMGGFGQGGAPTEICELMSLITLSDLVVEDEGHDGVWTAGETLSLSVTLESPEDNTWYPGIRVTHGNADILPDPADFTFFGVLANQPAVATVVFNPDDEAAPATVTFDIEVFSLNEECKGLATLTTTKNLE